MIRRDLMQRAERLLAAREPFVHATVVRAAAPTSVRPGDAALVLADGTIEGFVGGSCAQSSVQLHAARALETGEAILLRLLPGAGAGDEDPLTPDGVVLVNNPCLSGGALEIFLEPQLPAPRVVVAGDTPVARALEEVARAAGFDVLRGEPGELQPEATDAALVVASHGTGEERALAHALEAGVGYVALVASRRRGEAVRESLAVPDALRAVVHTPAGLDIGARTPAEIAISILAQIISERGAHARPHPVAAPAAAATAVDPVCGMEVLITADAPQLEVAGERFYFCCEGCRATYAERHAAGR